MILVSLVSKFHGVPGVDGAHAIPSTKQEEEEEEEKFRRKVKSEKWNSSSNAEILRETDPSQNFYACPSSQIPPLFKLANKNPRYFTYHARASVFLIHTNYKYCHFPI